MACVPSYTDCIRRREEGRGGECAFCLMNNHFHLLVETPQVNLSTAVRQLNGSIPKLLTAVTIGWAIFCPATSSRSSSGRRRAAAEVKVGPLLPRESDGILPGSRCERRGCLAATDSSKVCGLT